MPPASQPATPPAADPMLQTEIFWSKYQQPILIGLIVLLLGGAIYGGFRIYTARRDDAAAAQLATAKSPADYQKVIADYPSAPTFATANLMLAESQRKEQKLAEANATLKKFVDENPKHELAATAKMAMASNLDSLGKTDEAAEAFRHVAADYPRDFNAPFALLAQARLLKQKNQQDEARRICETVVAQYGESYASMEAQQMMRTLKPATPVVTAPAPGISPAPPAPNP